VKWSRIVLILVFILLAVLGARQLGGIDIGFHLKAGEQILSGDGWPRTDTFTYTVNDHVYIDSSWGFQVLIAAIYRAAGPAGLAWFQIVSVLGVFYLLLLTTRLVKTDPLILLLLFILSALVVEVRIDVRPEWVTYLFLASVLLILHRHAEGRPGSLRLLPVIMLVWVNTHSLFILGWAALACFVCGLAMRDRRLDRPLLGWSALSVVAVALVNPYGWKVFVFPITLVTRLQEGNLFSSSIGELLSPFAILDRPFYPRLSTAMFFVFSVLAVAALYPLIKQKRYHSVLLTIVFLPLGLRSVRNVPLPILAALPGVIWAFSGPWLRNWIKQPAIRFWSRRVVLGLAAIVVVALGLRVYSGAYYIADRRNVRFGTGWNRLMLAVDASEYINRSQPAGRMLNALDFGAHLMFAVSQPVFIDSRLEVIGERFYRYYLSVMSSDQALEQCVRRYDIGWIVFPFRKYPHLVGRLSRNPRWQLAYVDHLAVLYRLRTGASVWQAEDTSLRALREPHAMPPFASLPGLQGNPRRTGPLAWLDGLVHRQEFPREEYERAQFHYFRGEVAQSRTHFARAIEQSGGAFHDLYGNLGMTFFLLQAYEQAQECFEVVLSAEPDNDFALLKLREIEQRVRE